MAAGSAEQARIVDFTDIHSAREQLSCTVDERTFHPLSPHGNHCCRPL